MSNKDFLSQFSDENRKPDSFKEEQRIPVNRKPVNYKKIAIIATIILLAAALIAWLFLRPTISVPDFVGKNKTEISAWVKQQGIETSGIRVIEEYSFDDPEDTVTDQSVKAGSKVRKDVKATFTVSLGPDPEEAVNFPDIKSMNRSEIDLWIRNNKLLKTKVTQVYSEEIPEGEVISYEIKGGDESNFKRGTTLNIQVSKGPQPAGTATVQDFRNKTVMEAENWAKQNKISLNKVESFSNTVDAGLIISQSVDPNKTIKEGETLTVYVSKGKGITVPNFTAMNEKAFNSWLDGNSELNVRVSAEVYSYSEAYILDQSIPAGRVVSMSDRVTVTRNLGSGFYIGEEFGPVTGASADKLKDWISESRSKGLNVHLAYYETDSDLDKGTIVSHSIYTDKESYSDVQKLPLDVTIEIHVSNGIFAPEPEPVIETFYLSAADIDMFTNAYIDNIRNWINTKNADGLRLSLETTTAVDSTIPQGYTVDWSIWSTDKTRQYQIYDELPSDVVFTVTISE